jgi:hypothetical protein
MVNSMAVAITHTDAHRPGDGDLDDPATVIDLRGGPLDLHYVLRLVAQPPSPDGQGFLGPLLRGQDFASNSAGWFGCVQGKLPVIVGCSPSLQLGDVDRGAVGAAVRPGLSPFGGVRWVLPTFRD